MSDTRVYIDMQSKPGMAYSRIPQFSDSDYEQLITSPILRTRTYGPITNYPVRLVEDISRRETITNEERTELESFLVSERK